MVSAPSGYVEVPFNSPFNEQQMKLKENPDQESTTSKVVAYLSTSDVWNAYFASNNVTRETLQNICGGIGIVAGAIAVLILSTRLDFAGSGRDLLGGRGSLIGMGGAFGGMLGYGTGYVIAQTGAFVSGCIQIPQIIESNAYVQWQQMRSREMTIEGYKKFFLRDDLLRYFICPLKKDILEIPVVAANGIVYDHEELQRWRLVNGKPYPGWSGPDRDDTLKFHYGHINAILKRLEVIRRKLESPILDGIRVSLSSLGLDLGPHAPADFNSHQTQETNISRIILDYIGPDPLFQECSKMKNIRLRHLRGQESWIKAGKEQHAKMLTITFEDQSFCANMLAHCGVGRKTDQNTVESQTRISRGRATVVSVSSTKLHQDYLNDAFKELSNSNTVCEGICASAKVVTLGAISNPGISGIFDLCLHLKSLVF